MGAVIPSAALAAWSGAGDVQEKSSKLAVLNPQRPRHIRRLEN